jgi:hypothetical protein
MAMELNDEFGEELSTYDLIKRQQKLGASPLVIDRLSAMALGSTLHDRLNAFSDRQIGQLIFDFCWAQMYVDGPELSLVTQAIDRLRRSTGGGITFEEADERLKQRPICLKCGGVEMYLHYGIDEHDFWLCDSVSCSHKIYVG